jgi:hypothetical protein
MRPFFGGTEKWPHEIALGIADNGKTYWKSLTKYDKFGKALKGPKTAPIVSSPDEN